jgi:uncharacterized protein (TIGR02265 family)
MPDQAQLVDGSLLEGLFIKGMKVDPVLEGKLREVGYDIRQTEPRYPQKVFERSIAVAGAHLLPDMSPAQAQRELGRRLVDGFSKTVLGSVMLAVLPHVPPAMVINRLPRWFNATAPGSTARVEVIGPTERRMSMPNAIGVDPMPHLLCGVLERLIKGWTAIEVVSSTGPETVYRLAWN